MCRFINADGIIQTGQGMLDKNMFAYCLNNPVNKIDPNGTFALTSTFLAALLAAIKAALIEVIKITVIFIITVAVIGTVKWAAEKIKNKTSSKSSSKRSNRYSKNNTDHTVYKLVDPTTNEIKYVGRTVNPTARKQAHALDPDKKGLSFVTIKSGLNYYEARGLEQIAMLTYSTKNALNRINGISPNNPRLEDYMAAGRDVANYVGNQISNEILYWSGE